VRKQISGLVRAAQAAPRVFGSANFSWLACAAKSRLKSVL